MCHSQYLFSLFLSFQQSRVKMLIIKFCANDWIRTTALWYGSDHSAISTAPDQNIFPIVRSMHRTKIFPIQINAFFARSHLQQLFVTHREELQKIVFTIIKLKCNPFTLSLFLSLSQASTHLLFSKLRYLYPNDLSLSLSLSHPLTFFLSHSLGAYIGT